MGAGSRKEESEVCLGIKPAFSWKDLATASEECIEIWPDIRRKGCFHTSLNQTIRLKECWQCRFFLRAGTILKFERRPKPLAVVIRQNSKKRIVSHRASENRPETLYSAIVALPRLGRGHGRSIRRRVFKDPISQRPGRRGSPHARAFLHRCRGNRPAAHSSGGLALCV